MKAILAVERTSGGLRLGLLHQGREGDGRGSDGAARDDGVRGVGGGGAFGGKRHETNQDSIVSDRGATRTKIGEAHRP